MQPLSQQECEKGPQKLTLVLSPGSITAGGAGWSDRHVKITSDLDTTRVARSNTQGDGVGANPAIKRASGRQLSDGIIFEHSGVGYEIRNGRGKTTGKGVEEVVDCERGRELGARTGSPDKTCSGRHLRKMRAVRIMSCILERNACTHI